MSNECCDYESPYCAQCNSCGEEGCCSHIRCFNALTSVIDTCMYGKTYLNEAIDNRLIVKLVYRLIDRSKKKEGYTIEHFISDFEKFSNRIYRK